MLAANLRPNETLLAKYEMNSINTSDGNRARGQPVGTNKVQYPLEEYPLEEYFS